MYHIVECTIRKKLLSSFNAGGHSGKRPETFTTVRFGLIMIDLAYFERGDLQASEGQAEHVDGIDSWFYEQVQYLR